MAWSGALLVRPRILAVADHVRYGFRDYGEMAFVVEDCTCSGSVLCWRRDDDRVASLSEHVIEDSDIDFRPAIVVG